MISKYSQFVNNQILESILKVDDNFYDIINAMKNPLSQKIDGLFNNDIATTQNFIKASKEKSDEVSFVNDTQAQRMLKSNEDPFTKNGNSAKVGRLVRQLLVSNNVKITDQEIEGFVNDYKNAWDKKLNPNKSNLKFVTGEEIRKWYLEDNYVSGGGQLNNSCMRYQKCQSYLDIYVKNPEVCQLAILLNEDGKLLARGLFWTLNDGRYLIDRIYSRFDNDEEKIRDFIKENYQGKNIEDYNSSAHATECAVQLKNFMLEFYPYIDTLDCLNIKNGILSNRPPKNGPYLKFRETDGSYISPGYVYCDKLEQYIDENDAVEYDGVYYHIDDCDKDYEGEFVPKYLLIHSELYDGLINKDGAVETKYGLVPQSDIWLVIVDSKSTKEKMPGIFLDDKFVSLSRSERIGTLRFQIGILKELAFMDMFQIYHELKDARKYMKVYKTGNHGNPFIRLNQSYIHDGERGYNFTVYTTPENESKSALCFEAYYLPGKYASEVECKIFDLEREGDPLYINKTLYQKAIYSNMGNMKKYIEIVENCERITPAKKRKKLADILKYHTYNMRNDYNYQRQFAVANP